MRLGPRSCSTYLLTTGSHQVYVTATQGHAGGVVGRWLQASGHLSIPPRCPVSPPLPHLPWPGTREPSHVHRGYSLLEACTCDPRTPDQSTQQPGRVDLAEPSTWVTHRLAVQAVTPCRLPCVGGVAQAGLGCSLSCHHGLSLGQSLLWPSAQAISGPPGTLAPPIPPEAGAKRPFRCLSMCPIPRKLTGPNCLQA